MATIGEVLAGNIKALRSDQKLTQEALSERMGVTVAAVQGWEGQRRWPERPYITRLAKALDVPESRLFQDPDLIPEPSLNQALAVVERETGIKMAVSDDRRLVPGRAGLSPNPPGFYLDTSDWTPDEIAMLQALAEAIGKKLPKIPQ